MVFQHNIDLLKALKISVKSKQLFSTNLNLQTFRIKF